MSEEEAIKGEVREVDLKKITTNPYQPRKHFSIEKLKELALSIKTIGLIHPPVVRPLPQNQSSTHAYELVSGERRFRAVELAGLLKISVIIRTGSTSLSAQAALIENVQRVDLNPMEISQGLQRLIDDFDFNQEHIAKRIGKKRSTVSNYLRLLTLDENIQKSISTGMISIGHAKAILSITCPKQQNILNELIIRDGLSVRKAEKIAKKLPEKKEQPSVTLKKNVHLNHLAEQFQEKLGTKCVIQGNDSKGRLCIDYYSLDDLDRIIKLFGMNDET